jgi:hypothetical protein
MALFDNDEMKIIDLGKIYVGHIFTDAEKSKILRNVVDDVSNRTHIPDKSLHAAENNDVSY